jgi:hypothetical protein
MTTASMKQSAVLRASSAIKAENRFVNLPSTRAIPALPPYGLDR